MLVNVKMPTIIGEHSGSVVECLNQDRGVAHCVLEQDTLILA